MSLISRRAAWATEILGVQVSVVNLFIHQPCLKRDIHTQ